ncbi:MAG TPA: arylesterase [Rhizobiales bacterium]|nr:arylesterase [Hyphomicrobiales bacterium]
MPFGQAMAKPVKIVALGDSLTAGYGLATGLSYPVKLQTALKAKGFDVEIANAGVSGDTSSGGLARLDWSVGDDADIVIVELGANDALRGVDPAVTRKALTGIVSKLLARGKKVLLAGMLAPPNLGREYGERFEAIYTDLAKLPGVTFYRFFLDGVMGRPELVQSDGLHPTGEGVEVIVKQLLPVVISMLK